MRDLIRIVENALRGKLLYSTGPNEQPTTLPFAVFGLSYVKEMVDHGHDRFIYEWEVRPQNVLDAAEEGDPFFSVETIKRHLKPSQAKLTEIMTDAQIGWRYSTPGQDAYDWHYDGTNADEFDRCYAWATQVLSSSTVIEWIRNAGYDSVQFLDGEDEESLAVLDRTRIRYVRTLDSNGNPLQNEPEAGKLF